MISLQALMYGGGVVAVIIGYLYVKSAVQQRLLNSKTKEIEKVRSEAATIAKELDNAEKRKQIEQANQRLTTDGVDQQLHDKGYFRHH